MPRIPEMIKIKFDVYTRDCENRIRCTVQGNGPYPIPTVIRETKLRTLR